MSLKLNNNFNAIEKFVNFAEGRWRRESDRRHRNKMRHSSVAALLGGGAIPTADTEIKKGPTLADRPLASLSS